MFLLLFSNICVGMRWKRLDLSFLWFLRILKNGMERSLKYYKSFCLDFLLFRIRESDEFGLGWFHGFEFRSPEIRFAVRCWKIQVEM